MGMGWVRKVFSCIDVKVREKKEEGEGERARSKKEQEREISKAGRLPKSRSVVYQHMS